MQFVTALWRIDPEGGIYVGKFDDAAKLTIPDAPTRAKQLAFTDDTDANIRAVSEQQCDFLRV